MTIQRLRFPLLRSLFPVIALVIGFPAWGFVEPVHHEITLAALAKVRADVGGQQVGFGSRAVEEITEHNLAMDGFPHWALFDPEKHFTNEKFDESSSRLIELRNQSLDALGSDPPDGAAAREALGKALHAIQDFYSHTTWVDRGNSEIEERLGQDVLSDPKVREVACSERPSELSPAGAALPLTSAYFLSITGCNEVGLPEGKCLHGNFNTAPVRCTGINKDLDVAAVVERNAELPEDLQLEVHELHDEAYALAVEATRAYVQGIVDALEDDVPALIALLDVWPNAVFVIDRTTSMRDEIASVKELVGNFLGEETGGFEGRQYVLISYGESGVDEPVITASPLELLDALSELEPHDGLNSDCAEPANAAILAAIEVAPPPARIVLFSDASSKDYHLVPQVVARARAKQATVDYRLSGTCDSVFGRLRTGRAASLTNGLDPAFVRVAEETGGGILFLNSSQLPQLAGLTRVQLSRDLQLIERRQGEVEAGGVASISVPVDSTVSLLSVLVKAVGLEVVRLRRPSGELVVAGDADAELVELSSEVLLAVTDPAEGEWSLEIEAGGEYLAVAEAISSLGFSHFDLVAPNDDIHGGFFPLPGQPLSGAVGIGEATMSGPFASADFELLDTAGNALAALSLERGHAHSDRAAFLGELDLPAEPFRVAVTGLVEGGTVYRRIYPSTFRTQKVLVEILQTDPLEIAPGESGVVRFRVTNQGEAATFVAVVDEPLGFASEVAPSSLALSTGESVVVEVSLNIPTGTELGTTTRLTLTAANEDDPDSFNSAWTVARVEEPALAPVDLDEDGVATLIEDAGPNGGDGNDDGLLDSLQTRVSTLPAASGADFITLVATCPLEGVEAISETAMPSKDDAHDFGSGLVKFTLLCEKGDVQLLDHSRAAWDGNEVYRKYGPLTPGDAATAAWYTLPDVTFDSVELASGSVARAVFELRDGELGDTGGMDGRIVDPGAPGTPIVSAAEVIPTLSEWMMLLLGLALAFMGWLRLRFERNESSCGPR